MAELDTIVIYNPLDEKFVARFNGEPYVIEPKSEKYFAQFVGFHIAKHLSDHILGKEVIKLKGSAAKENVFNPAIGQLTMHDNIKRRMALYDILRSKDLVFKCIKAYPFKDFIGDAVEFDEYVTSKETPKESKPKKAKVEGEVTQ